MDKDWIWILGKDILGIVKFLETSQRFPLLMFCNEMTMPIPFCCNDGLLLLPGSDDGDWGDSSCSGGVVGLGVSSKSSSFSLLTSV